MFVVLKILQDQLIWQLSYIGETGCKDTTIMKKN